MLDTIVLTLDRRDFEVLAPERFAPSAQGLLKPPFYPLGARGNFWCAQNPTKGDLRAGRYRPRLTLINQRISGGYRLTLRIEFSAPKLVFGNNFDELRSRDFDRVLIALQQCLRDMDVQVSTGVLRNATVSAIHYSKNIAFTNYTTCSMVMAELGRIDMTKRLDLSHTQYRNEGHAIRYHANSFEIIFYDKLKDIERARYSERRSIEKDYGAQTEIHLRSGLLPKVLEVLRMEVRLGTRAKIRNVLGQAGIKTELEFQRLFDAEIARSVLDLYWRQIRAQQLLLINAEHKPEDILAVLARVGNARLKVGKLLQQLGSVVLIRSVGIRGASAVLSRYCNTRSWQRLKRQLKALEFADDATFSALDDVNEALKKFEPLRMQAFRALAA